MAWNRESLQTIYERMKADAESRVTNNVRLTRFSLINIILVVVSGAIHLMYGFLEYLSRQLFLDTAEGEYLDRKAREYGLPRKSATFAEGRIQFIGTPSTVIPSGTIVQNSNGFTYATISEVTLDAGGLGQSDIQADESGIAGNTNETILQMETPIAGVTTEVTVIIAPNGGAEQETDDELRARLLQRVQNPPASGNEADYIRWATSVEGVGRAWVLSAENYKGAGSVAVLLATSELEPVGQSIIDDVDAYIDTVRPVKAECDVLNVVTSPISFEIAITPNQEQLRQSVDTQLRNFFLNVAEPGGTILISGIRSAISSGGVSDYRIVSINVGGIPVAIDDITLEEYTIGKYDQTIYSDL